MYALHNIYIYSIIQNILIYNTACHLLHNTPLAQYKPHSGLRHP